MQTSRARNPGENERVLGDEATLFVCSTTFSLRGENTSLFSYKNSFQFFYVSGGVHTESRLSIKSISLAKGNIENLIRNIY